ncbi:PREDICTED: cingulin-like [Acropora digitifera]|uniref:cingulin-like n=1 Tax=Acropora digitifera TaxID=70779 RepID=UPI00077A0401|nr:PREDICTED: cingulin-like [Acropora digitifera]XP_015773430.1 PREDICTED: cingulin-like [Acropora digitifera]
MALSTFASGHSVLLYKDEAQKEFVTGIQWLDKAIGVLCKAEITRTTPAKTVKAITENLRLPIRQARTHLNTALKFWEGEKARQCEETERLISSISGLKSNVSERKMKVEQLNQQLQGLNQQIKDSKQKVEQAKRALSNAQDTLNDAERELRNKRRDQRLVAGIGVATLAVPGVGWIVSGIVASTAVVVSLTVLEDNVKSAQSGVSSAKDNVNYSENWLQAKKREKNSLCQQLKSEEKEKQITEQRLRDQERELQDLKMAQQRSIELSDKLMRTCHVLTNIWGKSQVLNNEASRAYSLEPLLTPVKEIVDMFTPEEQKEVKQNTFLLSQEIDFSSLTWKLKAVCDANADSSIMAILDEYC